MCYPDKETAVKHERIVKEAFRLFRERGFENVSSGEVMKAAGLTPGAFYAHFGLKEVDECQRDRLAVIEKHVLQNE
jgi:TetR/AcrR family transcriptional repressor of nem operon